MKIFLICKVRNCSAEEIERQKRYVEFLEKQGHTVHWPLRDTVQDDPTGGTQICRTTFRGIFKADQVHVMWDTTSEGRLFDLGMTFALDELVRDGIISSPDGIRRKRVIILNREEVDEIIAGQLWQGKTKSYDMVLRNLADER